MRMLEVAAGAHAEALHHGTRAVIGEGGEGHDLVEAELVEADMDRPARRLRGETLAPVGGGESPADLDAGREGQLGGGLVQADEADELAGASQLDRPETPAALRDQGRAAIGHRIALGTGEQ